MKCWYSDVPYVRQQDLLIYSSFQGSFRKFNSVLDIDPCCWAVVSGLRNPLYPATFTKFP